MPIFTTVEFGWQRRKDCPHGYERMARERLLRDFQRSYPCPSIGKRGWRCPGYLKVSLKEVTATLERRP